MNQQYIVTALGVVVFVSVCVTIPSMVASQMIGSYLINSVYGDLNCTSNPNYVTIYKTDTCYVQSKYVCLNSTHYTIESFNDPTCSQDASGSNLFPLTNCMTTNGETGFSTECISTLPPPLSNYFTSTLYSSDKCTQGTEIQITAYKLDSCFPINSSQFAKYTCTDGKATTRTNCDDDKCTQCEVDTVDLDQCAGGFQYTCVKGCDTEARQQCDVIFNECDLQSSACDCYQAWGQCVYDSGCDSDQSAEKSCQQFCGNAEPCKCNFANPCTEDSLSTSLLVNLLLVGGSILIYLFLLL
jgi:hypothetical protein